MPRLRDPHPFRVLEPKKLPKEAIQEAATIKGALKHGQVVALGDLPEIDFVLCGSVAVNLSGARGGKCGGYHDLEYGILVDAGKIDTHITVATTVHPIQILRRHLLVTAHDLPCDVIATPRAVIEIERQYDRPRGILWDHLHPPRSAKCRCSNAGATPEAKDAAEHSCERRCSCGSCRGFERSEICAHTYPPIEQISIRAVF